MKRSDLTDTERKVWEAAATGTLVDLRIGDSQLDSPERWAEWGKERTVRAEVIEDLLLGVGVAAAAHVRGVRLQGARITGCLDLEATTLGCPLALLDCFFASAINLNEATALSVRLSGAHVPALQAKQLLTRGDLWLDKGFCVSDGVDLAGAHIGGVLACIGASSPTLTAPPSALTGSPSTAVCTAMRGSWPAARSAWWVPTSVANFPAERASSPTPTVWRSISREPR